MLHLDTQELYLHTLYVSDNLEISGKTYISSTNLHIQYDKQDRKKNLRDQDVKSNFTMFPNRVNCSSS